MLIGLGDVFRDVNHFRQVLYEVMIRKKFNINIKYSELRINYATCKEAGCPWFVKGARLKIRMVFGCKDIRKSMNVSLPRNL